MVVCVRRPQPRLTQWMRLNRHPRRAQVSKTRRSPRHQSPRKHEYRASLLFFVRLGKLLPQQSRGGTSWYVLRISKPAGGCWERLSASRQLSGLTAILTAKTVIERGLRCTSVEWNSVNVGVHGLQWKPMDKLPQTFNPSVRDSNPSWPTHRLHHDKGAPGNIHEPRVVYAAVYQSTSAVHPMSILPSVDWFFAWGKLKLGGWRERACRGLSVAGVRG